MRPIRCTGAPRAFDSVLLGKSGTRAEQQLVIFAATERESQIVTHRSSIRRGQRDRGRINLGADMAAFENVSKILQEPVANVDRCGSWFDLRQRKSRLDARGRVQVALDEKSSGSPTHRELTAQNRQPRRGIADGAGDEEVVIRAREVAPRHIPGSLAQQCDGDCESIRARNVAADHIGTEPLRDVSGFPRRGGQRSAPRGRRAPRG